ncbi:hypothetical protein [Actinoplanes sp. NPDC051494]|uniref:hypothetical protein n=1 Tax=Actinoplanes sp. NPDC051494 TaxID=3363907 RepID=UPI003788EB29
MLLTQSAFLEIASYAGKGLRDCLSLIALHNRDRQRSFLNPGTVLCAVSTWERFVHDLVDASSTARWSMRDTGWNEDSSLPWPGSRGDLKGEDARRHRCRIDQRLLDLEVLKTPLTVLWDVQVATSWRGADPTRWRRVGFTVGDVDGDELRQAMLGAKSARDAAAHRLYFKKAHQALGLMKAGTTPDEADFLDWCYVWQSDNTVKSGADGSGEPMGRPTIQSGYARGVVGLFLQLVDQTIAAVDAHQDWNIRSRAIPAEWFASDFASKTLPRIVI